MAKFDRLKAREALKSAARAPFSSRTRLFNEYEVAEWIGLSVCTLRSMRSRVSPDPIPYVKIGRYVKYREDLVLKWLERNTFDDGEQVHLHRRGA